MSKKESNIYYNNQVINNIMILELDYKKENNYRYFSKLKCLTCNKEFTVLTFVIKKTKSCGCRNFKGKVYSKKKLYYTYKKQAEQRNLDFKLTYDELDNITNLPCFYCGIEKSRMINTECRYKHNEENKCNGIDRKNNELGYTKENSVPCCTICNRGKNSMKLEEWNNYLNNLVKFRSAL